MKRGPWISLVFLSFLLILSLALVIPTAFNLSEEGSYPFKSKINLGLDLQGGLYMILGIDFNRVYKDELVNYMEKSRRLLREEEDISATLGDLDLKTANDPRQILQIKDISQIENIKKRLRDYFGGYLRLTREDGGNLQYGLSAILKKQIEEQSVGKSIEIIRNRIDEFGVSEPEIVSQGQERIIVQLPGVKDIERAKELIGKTAKLEFKMVDDNVSRASIDSWIEKAKQEGIVFKKGVRYSQYISKLNRFLKKELPKGYMLAFERKTNKFTHEVEAMIPYLVEVSTRLTGEGLQDARVLIDQQRNMPYVSIDFKTAEASVFEKITAESIGKRMAIVLDGNVYSAPVIQSRIGGGRAQITLGTGGYNALFQEASDLALILRAGALPVQLDFLEQRTVGPGLGQDSIKKAKTAAIIGAILVFSLILFYYRISGAIAIFTLGINILFVLAILVVLEATLTLPGIAGIALTIGMAIDANIIIYERIREEIRKKSDNYYKAVQKGFNYAFWTIVDANITTAMAGICLFNFGTGPIRGFAITLLIGICATVYSSYFIGRMVFNYYMNRISGAKPSI